MKNKVMSIIFILLVVLFIVAIISGIKLGNFKILSVSELEDKNKELNERIETASELTSIDYPQSISTLEETFEKQTIQKQKYEEISGFNKENEKQIYETKQYDIAYLWKTIGKYATTYNLTIGMDVKRASSENLYNLYFTVSGEYVNISQFISSIENNSDLYFRIYNFKMSGSSEIISSSFTVKDVNIDPSTISNVSTITNTESENSNNTNAQTTNSNEQNNNSNNVSTESNDSNNNNVE